MGQFFYFVRDKEKGMLTTIALAIAGGDVVIIGYSSLSAIVPAGR